MKHRNQRRLALHAGAALGLGLLARPVRACEYFASTLRVTHPWCRATALEAGSVVVCMKFDEVLRTDRLIGVETPVAAGAELGGVAAGRKLDLLLPEGRVTTLSEEGVHLRLLGLQLPLEMGRSYPLKLIFEHGGELAATLNVDYARFR